MVVNYKDLSANKDIKAIKENRDTKAIKENRDTKAIKENKEQDIRAIKVIRGLGLKAIKDTKDTKETVLRRYHSQTKLNLLLCLASIRTPARQHL